jgi:hypothetical protein
MFARRKFRNKIRPNWTSSNLSFAVVGFRCATEISAAALSVSNGHFVRGHDRQLSGSLI